MAPEVAVPCWWQLRLGSVGRLAFLGFWSPEVNGSLQIPCNIVNCPQSWCSEWEGASSCPESLWVKDCESLAGQVWLRVMEETCGVASAKNCGSLLAGVVARALSVCPPQELQLAVFFCCHPLPPGVEWGSGE